MFTDAPHLFLTGEYHRAELLADAADFRLAKTARAGRREARAARRAAEVAARAVSPPATRPPTPAAPRRIDDTADCRSPVPR